MRRGGWTLQQGSIRLWPLRIPDGIFHSEVPASVSAGDILELDRPLLEQAIVEDLASLFRCHWQADKLDGAEEENVTRLVAQKYAAEAWTLNGESRT